MLIKKNVKREKLLDILSSFSENVQSPNDMADKIMSYLEEPDTIACIDCGKPLPTDGVVVGNAWIRHELKKSDGSPGRGHLGFVCNDCHDMARTQWPV